jgi:transcriptional regulator with XRE-family HTH domain
MVMFDAKMIRELKKALGLSAREFGERVGVTGNTVFRWQAGSKFPSRRHQEALNKLRKEAEERGLLQQVA